MVDQYDVAKFFYDRAKEEPDRGWFPTDVRSYLNASDYEVRDKIKKLKRRGIIRVVERGKKYIYGLTPGVTEKQIEDLKPRIRIECSEEI